MSPQQHRRELCLSKNPFTRPLPLEPGEEEIIPFQVSKGMVILGSFVGQEEDDLYVWIHRFESEEERERLYKAVYESDHWKNYIAPQIPDMLLREQIKVTRIE